MDISGILTQIDAEIARLQHIRNTIASARTGAPAPKRGPGRPKGSNIAPAKIVRTKRTLSPEARAKIAAAQKKRWAAAKKAVK